eukprot:TRINITY_DN14054_c0_g1_i1.p1 TRINITY_DN14054_c0_g1~~TRINITY_DN14054_c0_g1_i1.p1  ORF type:complete len:557 (-),score=173.74 TRINITY_DN14054_c0_g1_i1:162-1832(-)
MGVSMRELEQDKLRLGKALRGSDEEAKKDALGELLELGEAGAAQLGLASDVASVVRLEEDQETKTMAIEVLGGMGELAADFAESLVPLVANGKGRVKSVALGSLGMMGPAAGRHSGVVAQCLEHDSTNIRSAACLALANMQQPGFVDVVARCLDDKSSDVCHAAVSALGLMNGEQSKKYAEQVSSKLAHENKEVRAAALQFFAETSGLVPQYVKPICKRLMDDDIAVRQMVAAVFQNAQEGQEALVAEATEVLVHQDSRFKAAAAFALAGVKEHALPQAAAVAALLDDLSEDRSQLLNCMAGVEPKAPPSVRIPACAAMTALGAMGHTASAPRVAKLLVAASVEVRVMAAKTVGILGGDFDELLLPLLDAPQTQLRAAGAEALGKLAGQRKTIAASYVDKVAQLLADKSPLVRAAAAEALGKMGDEGAAYTDALQQLFMDSSVAVRSAAVLALSGVGIKGQMFAPEVCRKLYEDGPDVQIAAAQSLAGMGDRGASFADEVATLMANVDGDVRMAALEALFKMGEEGRGFFVSAAERAAKTDPVQKVRETAARLLKQ